MRFEEMPVIRVTLERMRQDMLHAFSGQLAELEDAAAKALAEALDERNIKVELRRLANETLDQELRRLVGQKVHEVIWDEAFQKEFTKAVASAIGKVKFVQ